MATLLVIGASRGIGLAAVRAALARGHDVRAFARSAEAIPIEDGRLTKIAGDACSPADLARAVVGADAVIQTLGIANPFTLTPVTLFSRATRLLIAAMEAAGVRRLVAVTGLGAGDSRGKGSFLYTRIFFPLVLERVYEDKDVQEKFIRDSALEWTIVRPGLLTNGPATGSYRAITEPELWRDGSISRADVAAFLIEEVEAPRFLRQTPLLIR